MALEVYLLSIPLARHRLIIPRPPGVHGMDATSEVRAPEQRAQKAGNAVIQSTVAPSALSRLGSR